MRWAAVEVIEVIREIGGEAAVSTLLAALGNKYPPVNFPVMLY